MDINEANLATKGDRELTHRIGVLLCAQHSLGSYGFALDAFRMANEMGAGHRFKLTRISPDGQPVPHVDGLLTVDAGLEALPEQDVVLIPSLWLNGMQAVTQNPGLVQALHELDERVMVVTLCTGAYLLAASGRLDGKRATTHWMLADGFQKRYPQIQMEAAANLTDNGGLVCSGGSMAGVDACLYVVQALAGRDLARNLARWLVTDMSRGPQSLFTPPQGWRRHPDHDINKLEAFMARHHDQTLSLEHLAEQIHVSVRTLQRRFLAATGMTPIQYQQAMRIERSKDLLESSKLPIANVAEQVGYQDRVAFGRLFKKLTGMTPAAYRQHRSPANT